MANLSKIKLPNGDEYNFKDTVTSSFSNVKVGSTTIEADTPTDTLELVAGTNVTLTSDATNDSVTINSKDEALQEQVDEITPTIELKEDQEFLYRQVPVNYGGTGTITRIKGNTVKFNQLVQNGNFADTSGWTYNEHPTFTVSNNIATVKGDTDFSGIYRKVNLLQNHKYYLSETLKAEVDNYNFLSGVDSLTSQNAKILTTNFQTFKRIATYTGSNASQALYFYDYNNTTRNNVYIKNVMFFDLTAIFGSGNEPSTVSDFETWLSNNIGLLPYYDYTLGDLISFNGSGLKTVGFNQWDEEWEVGSISGTTGQGITDNTYIRSKNLIRINPELQYYVAGNTGRPFFFLYYDANGNYIGTSAQVVTSSNRLFTPNVANASYCKFTTQTGGTYNSDICLNISDTSKNGTYEPYTENTLSLPISTYFSNGMASAKNAYSNTMVYDELTPNKAIKRLEQYTFTGNETVQGITQIGTYYRCYIVLPIPSKGTYATRWEKDVPNVYNYTNDNSHYYVQNSQFWYFTTSSTAQAILDELSGTKFYYELVTPTSQDISLDLTYPIWNNGTEQILPVNTSVPVTAPIIADIEYHNIAQKVIDVVDTIGGTTTINSIDNVGTLPTLTFTPDSTTGNLTISWSQGTLPVKGSDTSVIKSK